MPAIIDLDQSPDFQTKVVEIATPQKKTHLGVIVGLLITLLFFGALAFGAGWAVSRIKAKLSATPNKIEGNKQATSSSKVEGWIGYSDNEASFSIAYPPNWKAQAHDDQDAAGVLLSDENSSVEIWLRIDKAVSLSEEQKAGLKKTEIKTLQIDSRPALLTTNEYLAGNFFNILVLPATESKPQVTYWLKAADEEALATEMKIVESFKFD